MNALDALPPQTAALVAAARRALWSDDARPFSAAAVMSNSVPGTEFDIYQILTRRSGGRNILSPAFSPNVW